MNTNDLPIRIRIPILYLNPVKFSEKHNYLSVQIAKSFFLSNETRKAHFSSLHFSLFSVNILTSEKLQPFQIAVYNINVSIELILKFEHDGLVNLCFYS